MGLERIYRSVTMFLSVGKCNYRQFSFSFRSYSLYLFLLELKAFCFLIKKNKGEGKQSDTVYRLDTPSQVLRAGVNRLMSLHGIDLYTASMTVINYSVLVKTKLINFPKICILLILQRSGSKLFLKTCYFNKETQGFWVFRKFITTAQPQKVTKCLPPHTHTHTKTAYKKNLFCSTSHYPSRTKKNLWHFRTYCFGEINVPEIMEKNDKQINGKQIDSCSVPGSARPNIPQVNLVSGLPSLQSDSFHNGLSAAAPESCTHTKACKWKKREAGKQKERLIFNCGGKAITSIFNCSGKAVAGTVLLKSWSSKWKHFRRDSAPSHDAEAEL